jgi:hypothetical protein
MFDLQEALIMRQRLNEEDGTVPTTELTAATRVTLSNLVMLYRLVEILAFALVRTNRGLVPHHRRIPRLGNPQFKVVFFYFNPFILN